MDTKESILESINQKALINDIALNNMDDDLILPGVPKRARLDVNYSITTTPTSSSISSQKAVALHQNRRKAPLVNRMV